MTTTIPESRARSLSMSASPPTAYVARSHASGPVALPNATSLRLPPAPLVRVEHDDRTLDDRELDAPRPPSVTYPKGTVAAGAPAAPTPVSPAVLSSGSEGPAVRSLQESLNKAGARPPLRLDGRFGRQTERALRAYQAARQLRPDGVAGNATLAALAAGRAPASAALEAPTFEAPTFEAPAVAAPEEVDAPLPSRPHIELVTDGEWSFPLARLPSADWHTGARFFGARRSHGKRKHGGCDVLGPVGTQIYAVADGTLVRPPYRFYEHVDAVEIRHGKFIIRYGEILPGSYVGGKTVKKGQPICKIGRLDSGNSMLHFEMYSHGESSAPLTERGRPPFQRRADLMDPTKYLDEWSKRLPR